MKTAYDIDTLIEDFSYLEDWEDRYTHVIELGKALPRLDEADYIAANKVKGCASQVWLVSEQTQERPPRLIFHGDSDAHIVKGLVAIVLMIFSGRTAAEILAIDAQDILARLGLEAHLSSQRANGLKSMIARIKTEAEAVASGS